MAGRIMSETVSARYEFTDKERADLGRELAEIYQHKITLDEERKAAASQIKERSDTLDLKSGSLSRQVMAGFEMRQVECTLQWDHPNVGEVTYWRKDNGAELKVRPMTTAERQMDLPLEGNGGPQLLEFPTQVENSVERSAAAAAEFFDSADKANVPEPPVPEPTEHPEPPADWLGSQEEYEEHLKAQKEMSEAAPKLPPMDSSPGKKSTKKK